MKYGVVVGLLLAGSLTPPVWAADCTHSDTFTSTTATELSAVPVKICRVLFRGTTNVSACQVFSSPTTTNANHDQAKTLSEPGVAVAGDSALDWRGENPAISPFGVGVIVTGTGTCLVDWDN